jgi:hypothetical protein
METMVKDKDGACINLFRFHTDPKKDSVMRYTPRPVPSSPRQFTDGPPLKGWDGDHGFMTDRVFWYHYTDDKERAAGRVKDENYLASLISDAPERIKARAMAIRRSIQAVLTLDLGA